MSRSPRILAVTACAALLSGCASVKSIDFPDTASNKGKKVTASISHLNLLYLMPPSNIDRLIDDLSEQCGGGKVEGISVTDTRRYFFYFGQNIHIFASGRCAE